MLIAELVYDVKARIILDSCVRAVTAWDIITSMIKAWVFGLIISVVRCPPPLSSMLLKPGLNIHPMRRRPVLFSDAWCPMDDRLYCCDIALLPDDVYLWGSPTSSKRSSLCLDVCMSLLL